MSSFLNNDEGKNLQSSNGFKAGGEFLQVQDSRCRSERLATRDQLSKVCFVFKQAGLLFRSKKVCCWRFFLF